MIGADLQQPAGHDASPERMTALGQRLPGYEWQDVRRSWRGRYRPLRTPRALGMFPLADVRDSR
jgi:hypothetical protein